MARLIICRGIPGSGKSTWAKQWVLENPEKRIRFNFDDLRNMMGKYWVPSRENLLKDLRTQFLYKSMTYGYDIVIDNMNFDPRDLKLFENIINDWNNPKGITPDVVRSFYELEIKDFFTPLDICIERDSKRENPIGEETIKKIYEKYKNIIENGNSGGF